MSCAPSRAATTPSVTRARAPRAEGVRRAGSAHRALVADTLASSAADAPAEEPPREDPAPGRVSWVIWWFRSSRSPVERPTPAPGPDGRPARPGPTATGAEPAPAWRELLDPESLLAADFLDEVLPQPLHTLGLEGVRRFAAPQAPPRWTQVASVTEEDATWTDPFGVVRSVPVRIYRPHTPGTDTAGLPCLLYLHGGGFTVASPDGVDEVCRLFSHHAECVVVSVDYRLAPEHPFPAAIDDTRTAHAWLVENADRLRIDSRRIAVAGDSAG
ncbi:alpha/beta hydrolase, partial [Streptomyces carpinensis]|uniref:alpha/beta hydrolase n=1 Tax=Streptomyces carpinensis TaxID=66369 RepID=UPI001ABFFF2B